MKFDPNGSGKLRADIKVTLPLSSRSQRTSGAVWALALLTLASYMSTCLNTGPKKTLHEQKFVRFMTNEIKQPLTTQETAELTTELALIAAGYLR